MRDATISQLQADLAALVPLAKLGLSALDGTSEFYRADTFIDAGLFTGEHIKGVGWVESETATRAREVLRRIG